MTAAVSRLIVPRCGERRRRQAGYLAVLLAMLGTIRGSNVMEACR